MSRHVNEIDVNKLPDYSAKLPGTTTGAELWGGREVEKETCSQKSCGFKSFLRWDRVVPALTELRSLFHHRGTRYDNSLDCCAGRVGYARR